MRFTKLSDHEVRPGMLVEWHPLPLGGWTPDPRPASYVQDAHVRDALTRRATGRNSPTWLATAFELPGDLDTAALHRALLAWIDRHETLRSVLTCPSAPDEAAPLRRLTLSSGGVDLRRKDQGRFDGAHAINSHVEALFDRTADPLHWPPYAFATVARGGSTTIYLGLDHSNVDGYSILLIAQEIRALYAAELSGEQAELAATGSYLEFGAAERDNALRVRADHDVVARWRTFIGANGGRLPGFPLEVGASSGRPAPQHGSCTWLLDADKAESFSIACRTAGGGFQAGILACLGIAAHEVSARRAFHALVPFHTRQEAQWTTSLGWYVGIAPVEFAVAGTPDFAGVAKAAGAAAREARPLALLPFARVCELLGTAPEPRFVVSYMDMRRTPGAGQWRAWNACAFHSRAVAGDEVYLWIHRNHEGVYLTCRHPGTEAGTRNATRYIGHLRRVVDEVATHGGYAVAGLPPIPAVDMATTW
ncbi:Condensation domain-containing protein [Amycolatopsis marina]|uniref:Condensation domain-containing protein n=1 Tax=Amycolatopsis marina TaxID=490629 RepID=A0A1I1AH58_9PSEU|nr:condensation domain-containing protein [Amycolatopsis marina]SFB36822.1 Condensation domain-containing protein [Amycolatopsis marina]